MIMADAFVGGKIGLHDGIEKPRGSKCRGVIDVRLPDSRKIGITEEPEKHGERVVDRQ